MLKLVFGLFGLLVALAVAASLARSHLGWTLPFGPAPANAVAAPQRTATGDRAAGNPATGGRSDASAAAARARPPQTQPSPPGKEQNSVFQRQEEALQKSVDRYKRADP